MMWLWFCLCLCVPNRWWGVVGGVVVIVVVAVSVRADCCSWDIWSTSGWNRVNDGSQPGGVQSSNPFFASTMYVPIVPELRYVCSFGSSPLGGIRSINIEVVVPVFELGL